jgi:hypothetical protein
MCPLWQLHNKQWKNSKDLLGHIRLTKLVVSSAEANQFKRFLGSYRENVLVISAITPSAPNSKHIRYSIRVFGYLRYSTSW